MRARWASAIPSQMPLGARRGDARSLGVQAFPLSPGDAGAVARARWPSPRARAFGPIAPAGTGTWNEPDRDRPRWCCRPRRRAVVASSARRRRPARGVRRGPVPLPGADGDRACRCLGVAEKRPERDVVALLGDGETLMGASRLELPGSLHPTARCRRAGRRHGHDSPAASRSACRRLRRGRRRALGLATDRARRGRDRTRRCANCRARRCSRSATTSARGQVRRRRGPAGSCAWRFEAVVTRATAPHGPSPTSPRATQESVLSGPIPALPPAGLEAHPAVRATRIRSRAPSVVPRPPRG